eukprot:Gregarina_sp_Poly_1__3229@NODE_191_length_11641_cov_669_281061_g170_i0_p8_GENE_NODE_191_length_11641_cov_669_281061_g170_i0NODE_191_length_11641_cov_669_281061_g170_i0_p8_ORF_typecomplete_len163_score13_49_NODE_191_length_11641_cov_669_281061_g170_i041234611
MARGPGVVASPTRQLRSHKHWAAFIGCLLPDRSDSDATAPFLNSVDYSVHQPIDLHFLRACWSESHPEFEIDVNDITTEQAHVFIQEIRDFLTAEDLVLRFLETRAFFCSDDESRDAAKIIRKSQWIRSCINSLEDFEAKYYLPFKVEKKFYDLSQSVFLRC